jgi:formamidopyrimidine-DNA glycosylase
MPELPEVEAYRRLAEEAALGRPVAKVVAPDAWYLK